MAFSEVKGMPALNNAPPCKVKSKTTYSIEVELDSSTFGTYQTGTYPRSSPWCCPLGAVFVMYNTLCFPHKRVASCSVRW